MTLEKTQIDLEISLYFAEMIPKMFISYEKTFGDHFKQGKVTSVDTTNKKVLLEGGDDVSYDVLVICTGSSIHFPAKIEYTKAEEAMEEYKAYLEKVRLILR